jgi:hypothetical protein
MHTPHVPPFNKNAPAIALLAALLLAPAQAGLAAPRVEDEETTKKARALYIEGSNALAEGDWELCRAALLHAWVLKKQYQIAGNLGICELELELNRDAAESPFFVEPGVHFVEGFIQGIRTGGRFLRVAAGEEAPIRLSAPSSRSLRP